MNGLQEQLEQCRRFRADLSKKVNQATAENLEKSREIERLRSLLGICYQIAGSALLCPDENHDKEAELLLNTLARPDGPGATILLAKTGPFQEVTDSALEAERLDSQTGEGVI